MDWSQACQKCDNCGMDMDMGPYCVSEKVISLRIKQPDAYDSYPYGLDISRALPLCEGRFLTSKKIKSK